MIASVFILCHLAKLLHVMIALMSIFAYMCKYMHHVASVFILAHSVLPFILLIFLVEATALCSFSPNISLK